jgi:RNA recognition motif-containing protein
MKIFVDNLSPETSEEDLRRAFAAFGQVTSVEVPKYRSTGQARGFGFVEMPDKAQGGSAIAGLDLQKMKGWTIMVDEAQPQPEGARASSA